MSTIAVAYLPQVTRRFGAILSLQTKLPADAVTYNKTTEFPAGATGTSYLLHTEEAVAAYRKVGAMVVPA